MKGETAPVKPRPKRYASSIEVARRAGVSQSAVSRTFTTGASVSKKTRDKVLKAAEELGYSPSKIPRIMLNHHSALIALVVGALDHPDYAEAVELFTRAIQKMGSRVLLFAVDHDQFVDAVIPDILSYRVDGVISALSVKSKKVAESCARANLPVVLFNSKVTNDWVASVCCDNVGGGADVASLFLAHGARRFGFIAGPKGNPASEERLAGFLGRLAEADITGCAVTHGDFRYESGRRAVLELMRAPRPPEAIFCANDLMAIGAMETLRTELGLEVPGDVMLAGFDGLQASGWPSYQITSVRQDTPRMVDEAVSLLAEIMRDGSERGGMLRIVRSPLVERKSTMSLTRTVARQKPAYLG